MRARAPIVADRAIREFQAIAVLGTKSSRAGGIKCL